MRLEPVNFVVKVRIDLYGDEGHDTAPARSSARPAQQEQTLQQPQAQSLKQTIKTIIENGEVITMVIFDLPLKQLSIEEAAKRHQVGDLQASTESSRRYLQGESGVRRNTKKGLDLLRTAPTKVTLLPKTT